MCVCFRILALTSQQVEEALVIWDTEAEGDVCIDLSEGSLTFCPSQGVKTEHAHKNTHTP